MSLPAPEDTCAQHIQQQMCAEFFWLRLDDMPITLARNWSRRQPVIFRESREPRQQHEQQAPWRFAGDPMGLSLKKLTANRADRISRRTYPLSRVLFRLTDDTKARTLRWC